MIEMSLRIELNLDELEREEEQKKIELLENKIHELELLESIAKNELIKARDIKKNKIYEHYNLVNDEISF